MAEQIVLITGGSGGIGSELARRVVARGDSVALFARRPEPLEALAAELGDEHALAIVGDATQPDALEQAVASTVERFGRLDALAHCVGSIHLRPIHLTTPEEFGRVIQINLTSAFSACRAALGPMRKEKAGSIVLVSTVAARQGLNNHEAIAAAKAGIEGLVRSAAITYARSGVRFNAVAPGMTQTPLTAPLLDSDAGRAYSESLHPLGQLGEPSDIARMIAFLVDPASSWITGQVFGVDGGLGAGMAPPKLTSRAGS